MSYVLQLNLTQFRSYERAQVDNLSPGLNVLFGPNGAGKTNVLEAISLLSPGRGLRSATNEEIQRYIPGEPVNGAWSVAATVCNTAACAQIGTGIDPATQKRTVRINGATAKNQMALSDYLSCLWLTPQMDRLFIDSAGGRRRFFDKLVFTFDPGHAGRVTRYENAMAQRSKLLREGGAEKSWLASLESQMAETGVAIAAARFEFLQRLQTACDAVEAAEARFFPKSTLFLNGTVEELLLRLPAVEVEDMVKYQLSSSRLRDAETGGAATGPHKSDLCVRFAAKDMPADQCSTGEQKALLIGIILAHARLMAAEKGDVPVLLLDEIAAHLDEARRAALFDRLTHIGGQVFMTGTDEMLFSACRETAFFYGVSGARIHPKNQPLAA
jgi:DNA replication and repair protein RecF